MDKKESVFANKINKQLLIDYVTLNDDQKTQLPILRNGHSYIPTSEEFFRIMEELLVFYKLDNIHTFIDSENEQIQESYKEQYEEGIRFNKRRNR